MNTFLIKDFVGMNAMTLSDGEKIYQQIYPLLKDNNKVELNFDGVNIFSTPFFNASIGKLLQDLEPEQLNKLLLFTKLNPLGVEVAKRVIKNAKEYYSNPAVKAAVDKIISDQADDV